MRIALASLAAVAACTLAHADVEYDVTLIPKPEGAFSAVPMAVNNAGTVVGWSLHSPAYIKAWFWTAETGTILLPAPPGMPSRYAAMDISEDGVIVGDGAYDTGMVWMYAHGEYAVVGTLPSPSLNGSRSPHINAAHEVVANAFNTGSVLVPEQGFLYSDGELTPIAPTAGVSQVGDINDAGQITAFIEGLAVRIEPDGAQMPIPIPTGYVNVNAGLLNANGDIAGVARCSHECNTAFYYSDDTGVIVIPQVGVRHTIGGVNDASQVVGGVAEGVSRGWIWEPGVGTRLLQDLIDPALNLQVWDGRGINQLGQVLASGADISTSIDNRRMMLLTPVNQPAPGDLNDDGLVNLADLGMVLADFGCQAECVADCDADGDTDLGDLGIVLAGFDS